MPNTVVSQDNAARVNDNANLIWGAAERLRGKIKPADYGKIILPFTVLRRMDCLLEPQLDKILFSKTGMVFYGTSEYSLSALLADPENIADNLKAYINGLSQNMREVFIEHFDFFNWINRLDKQDLLYALVKFLPTKTCTPKPYPRWKWAICSKTSSASSTRPATPPPATTSPRAKSSA